MDRVDGLPKKYIYPQQTIEWETSEVREVEFGLGQLTNHSRVSLSLFSSLSLPTQSACYILHTYTCLCANRVDGGRLRRGLSSKRDQPIYYYYYLLDAPYPVYSPRKRARPIYITIFPPSNLRKWRPLKRGRDAQSVVRQHGEAKDVYPWAQVLGVLIRHFGQMHDVLRILPLSCGHHLLKVEGIEYCNRTTSDTQLPRTCVSYSTTS